MSSNFSGDKDIPEGWQCCKLGDFIGIKNGYAFKSSEFEDEGVPIVKIKNITPPKVSFDDIKFYNKPIDKKIEPYLVKKNDILISMTGSHINQIASAVGRVARYDSENPSFINQRVSKLFVDKPEIADENFLYYFISMKDVQYNLAASASGSANQANISPDQIKNLEIFIPTLYEQKVIGKILNSIDQKIELNQKINQILEEICQAIFKQWFVHFEFPNEEGQPYKSNGGEMIDSELGEIPDGWEVANLSDICSKVIDGTHDSPSPEDEGYYLVTGRHIVNGFIDFSKCYKISSEEHEKVMKRSMPEKGDTIFSNIGTLGTATYVDQDFEFSIKNVALFKPLKPIYSSFIYLYFISPNNVKQMENSSSGTTQRFFSLKFLRGWEMIRPSDEILSEFNDIISPLLSLRTSLHDQNVNLSKIRDSILPKLMSGKIRVRGNFIQIEKIEIEGIKSHINTKLTAEDYNTLVGENNSGKSNIIFALQWFFKHQNTKLSKEDVNTDFKRNPSVKLEFSFYDYDVIPSEFLEDYADDSGKKFQVEAYNEIKKINEKPQFAKHRLIKEGKKPKSINLPKIVDIIFVPSIKQLDDELKFTANSTINKLVSKYVIERVHAEDAKSQKYTNVKVAIEELSDYIGDGDDSAFGELKKSLKRHMLDYGDKEIDFTLNPPKPDALIKNSFEPYVDVQGNKLKVNSQGMGYQRSLIFSLICNMAEVESSSTKLLNLYLIEEPELFLHPNHQNHFKNRLMQLSRQYNNQIILTSHSPYFLNNIDNFSQVKRISISNNISNLREITHDEVALICEKNGKLMADAYNYDGRFSKTELDAKTKEISDADELRYLLWIDPKRANAFLSKKVLLVEGSTEKAFFSFIFNNSNGDFYHHDKKSELIIIDINGKYHFYKFANLLNRLGIPTWILYDGDKDQVSNKISHKFLNQYIVQMEINGIIRGSKRIDHYLEDFLGIEKEKWTPDISIYQKLVKNENGCRNSQNYEEIMDFIQEILDYGV